MVKTIVLALLLLAAGYVLGLTYSSQRQPAEKEWQLADALPIEAGNKCVLGNKHDLEVYRQAHSMLKVLAKDDDPLWLEIGIMKFLSNGLFRTNQDLSTRFICPSEGYYKAISTLLTEGRMYQGRLEEYQLKLAYKLPVVSDYIVKAVANSAFESTPQQSETFETIDIRPFARMVLASFGKQAAPYAELAAKQINSNDSMGTSAAQVAAAGGYPRALPKIKSMMESVLSSVPKDKVIPFHKKNRLFELAYALQFSKNGKAYAEPLHELMKRKVEVFAPPFGMVDVPPESLCIVLARIEGNQDLVKSNYDYCKKALE